MRLSLKFILVWITTICAASAAYASVVAVPPQDPSMRLWRALFQGGLVLFVGAVWHFYYFSRRASDVAS